MTAGRRRTSGAVLPRPAILRAQPPDWHDTRAEHVLWKVFKAISSRWDPHGKDILLARLLLQLESRTCGDFFDC